MTVNEIIRAIETLPPKNQVKVVRFAYRLDAELKLTGRELSLLAGRMVQATDPKEELMVREEIVRGFYGSRPSAWDPASQSADRIVRPSP